MEAITVFLARVKDENGKFPFVKVQFKKGKPVKLDSATAYYARYTGTRSNGSSGRVVKPLGSDLDVAYVSFLNIDTVQKAIRAGQVSKSDALQTPASSVPLGDAIEEYLESAAAAGTNTAGTLETKRRVLESFLNVCHDNGVFTVDQIKNDPKVGRRVLLAYLTWMRENLKTQDLEGARPENTWHSRMRKLQTFFIQHGIAIKKQRNGRPNDPGLLTHAEFPKNILRKSKKYSVETMKTLLKVADMDETDLIQFFLFTGFRDDEVAHVEWPDINFIDLTVNVHAKAQTATRLWSWKPKDDESREIDIPLSKNFVERLAARRARYADQKCALVFPSSVCKPNVNLLRIVRNVAVRAGVPPNLIKLHNLRRTFASDIAKDHGIEMARKCLGHAKVETTQGYLAADEADLKQLHSTIGQTQSKYATGG